MIYGRFGDPVQILRAGTLEDVKTLDKRVPDKADHENIKNKGYVVVRDETNKERLYHLAYLRADDGFKEVADEMRRLGILEAE